MAEMCVVCGKTEAARKCEVCGAPICEADTREVLYQELTPASMVKPGVAMSPIRAGQVKKKVCPKCMQEAEIE